MFSLRSFVVFFCLKFALCLHRQQCDDDDECFINAVIERVYPRFVAGIPGVETSDPMHVDGIVADLPNIKYALFNATLTGLKNCLFVKLDYKHLSEYTLFDYAISCPALSLQAEYDLNGVIDSIPVEGKGDCKIIYENYHISISGKRDKIMDDEGRQHVNIQSYTIIPDLKEGKLQDPVYTNLDFGTQPYADRVRIIEEMTRDVVMDVFMNKFMQNLKNFHHQVPTEDLHYKYVR